MTRFGGDNVTVGLPGGCQCPGTPHEQDEVHLLPRLTFDGGAAGNAVLQRWAAGLVSDDPKAREAFERDLSVVYLTHQVAGWNLVDDSGKPIPYSPDMLLSDYGTARAVADRADDLYSEALLAPLAAAVSTSSPAGRTAGATSRSRPPSGRRRKP